jgi:AcrR family transcriptional regulator
MAKARPKEAGAPGSTAATQRALATFGAPVRPSLNIWQLPRGPNANAPASDVTNAQRSRLLFAIVRSVAEKGYVATTIADVARIARVSRSAFYALFEDKEACFLAAYEAAHMELLTLMRAQQREGMNWIERMETSLDAYLHFKRDNPEMAYAMLVEIHAVGAGARAKREWGHQRFARFHQRLYLQRCAEEGIDRALPDEVFLATVAAVEEIVAAYVCQRRTAEIMKARDAALYVLHAIYGGGPPAAPRGMNPKKVSR